MMRRPSRSAVLPLMPIFALSAACYEDRSLGGVVGARSDASDEPSAGSGGGAPMGGAGGGGSDAGAGAAGPDARTATVTCPAIAPGPNPLRGLSPREYLNTLQDLFATVPVESLTPPQEQHYGYFDTSATRFASAGAVETYFTNADIVGKALSARGFKPLVDCALDGAEAEACGQTLVTSLGRRLFRRPLSPAEVRFFGGFFSAASRSLGPTDGARAVITLMLQAPRFLYRPELGSGVPSRVQGVVGLDPFQLATRLAYFATGTTPDESLLNAAENGRLSGPEDVRSELDRLFRDARGRAQVRTMFDQWLSLRHLPTAAKDGRLFPSWTPQLAAALRTEVLALVESVIFDGDRRFSTLLTTRRAFVDDRVATVYGVAPLNGGNWSWTELDPAQRAGLFTRAGVLAQWSRSDATSPVQRGVLVRERILCDPLEPPPADVPALPEPKPLPPDATTRERYSVIRDIPECWDCHRDIDPIGFGFEHYTTIGSWRDRENGRMIDDSGEVVDTSIGTFQGAIDLSNKLAQSRQVHDCVVTRWFQFAFGRDPSEQDACTVAELKDVFSQSGGDHRVLFNGIVSSDAFLFRPTTATGHNVEELPVAPTTLGVSQTDGALARERGLRKGVVDALLALYTRFAQSYDGNDRSGVNSYIEGLRDLERRVAAQ